jgi:hypothetical protein
MVKVIGIFRLEQFVWSTHDAQHRGVIRPKVRAGFSKGSLLLAIFPDHVADSTSGRILGGGIGVPVPEIGQSLETEFSRPERACAST